MMQTHKVIIVAALTAIICSYGVVKLNQGPVPVAEGVSHATETTLARIKRTGILRCGYNAWPPFFELDPNTKKLTGISKDFSDQIIALAGWKIEYIDVPVGNDVQDLRTGKVDAMCGAGPWYMAAIKEINFTRPYDYAGVYIYGNEDENRFAKPEDLNSPQVQFVGMDGDLSADLVQRFYSQAKIYTLPGTTDLAQMLLNVTTRKADVVIVDPISVENFNKDNEKKLKPLFPDKPVVVYGAGFSVRKSDNDLLETLNGFTEMAINMGIPDKLLKQYDPNGTMFLFPAKGYQQRLQYK
ncbi:MAG: substrate-binding periplasmic protein [Dongiaceae bacterium]